MQSVLTRNQKRIYGPKIYTKQGETFKLTATVRYDDQCKNGHNSFAITGAQYVKNGRGEWREDSFGCMHDTIAKRFPDLAPFIKWHGMTSEGPMHYIANTIYHAGDRDHWGLQKGEASTDPKHQDTYIQFGNSPITHKVKSNLLGFIQAATAFNKTAAKTNPNYVTFEPVPVAHINRDGDTYKYADKYTFKGLECEWYQCPFDSRREAQEWQAALRLPYTFIQVPTLIGEGKPRNLDYARASAVWPDATDDDLIAPGLKERLEARLPALMQEFRQAVESLGFIY